MLKYNKENIKLCLTNYRWYIAVLWALFLIPVWFLPQLVISYISMFFAWFALRLEDIVDDMSEITYLYFTWAVHWFYRSLPEDVVEESK